MKFRKLEKLSVKLPSEILAFKLLRNANLNKQERMLVLTGVNFAEKEKMYQQTKDSLIKFMGYLTEEKAGAGPNVRLEPAWKKSASNSYRKGCAQHRNIWWVKKKLNPIGPDGKILLCNSCGSYRHLVAECQDSWENIAKRKTSEFNAKLRGQSNKNTLKGDENSRESVELEEVYGVPVTNKQLVEEVTQLKANIRNLKTEIEEIMVVKDKELKIQKEEFLSHVKIIEQENEGQQKESGTTLQMLIQSIMKLQKEVKLLGTEDHDRQTRKKMKLNENNRTKQRLLEKAKKVKLKLQMTPEKTNTSSWISEKK